MAEHVEIINAAGTLRAAVTSGDGAAVEAAKERVAGLLWPHTQAEEVGLFRVMAQDETYAQHIAELCGEHELLDAGLRELRAGDTVGMTHFEHLLREHIHKEDNGLFPAAAVALYGEQWNDVLATTPAAT